MTMLDFDIKFNTPVFFLERYLHLFGLDREESDMSNTAYSLCQFMQRESLFLKFKPSQLASACLILAINMINKKANYSSIPLIAEHLR